MRSAVFHCCNRGLRNTDRVTCGVFIWEGLHFEPKGMKRPRGNGRRLFWKQDTTIEPHKWLKTQQLAWNLQILILVNNRLHGSFRRTIQCGTLGPGSSDSSQASPKATNITTRATNTSKAAPSRNSTLNVLGARSGGTGCSSTLQVCASWRTTLQKLVVKRTPRNISIAPFAREWIPGSGAVHMRPHRKVSLCARMLCRADHRWRM